METYYTLSASAGLIRSNKFNDQADAVCMGTFRAEHTGLPVKILEHTEPGDGTPILICMADGSVQPPEGAGMKTFDLGNASSGAKNSSEAFMLLSSFENMPITTYYLKSELTESQAAALEKELDVELGLYDPKTLHAYTEDSTKLRGIESKLAEASVEIENVRDSKVKKQRLSATADLVTAARKGHKMARASRMPEVVVKGSSRQGSGFKLNCHCEMVEASGAKSPKIRVFGDGQVIGEVKSDREASEVISDYAQRAFAKFLKKELA